MKTQMFIVNQGNLNPLSNAVFTTGDAYIVVDHDLKVIYIWLGSKCSVDEKGTAAVEARRIDDGQAFNGSAKIITIDEGEETKEFMEVVKNLKIVDKNLAKSMLKDVSTGEFADQANHVNALYRISSEEYEGINAIKYIQVPFEVSSLDSEDCFMADLGVDVWVWQGKDSNVKEKVKAMQIAREFDADRAGDQKPRVFMEGDDDADFLGIFEGKLPTQDRKAADLRTEVFDTPKQEEQPPSSMEPETTTASASPPMPDDSEVMVQKGEGRIACPKCGNSKRSLIREAEDHTNIIMAYPRIYGKKWICGECGAEWKKTSV